MVRPDLGRYPITQGYRANAAYYAHGLLIDPLGYGVFGHTGVDFGMPIGAPVVASISGSVTRVGENPIHGRYIVVSNSEYNVYTGHMSRMYVTIGQPVEEGRLIGLSGSTGRITGPHCHWEITDRRKSLCDPFDILKGENNMASQPNAGDRRNIAILLSIPMERVGDDWHRIFYDLLQPHIARAGKPLNAGDVTNISRLLEIEENKLEKADWNDMFYSVLQPTIEKLLATTPDPAAVKLKVLIKEIVE